MIEVKGSSAIQAIEMGPDGLRVQFTSGKAYEYAGVSHKQMVEMLQADSPGRYFAQEIRNNYEGKPVDLDEEPASNSPEDLGFDKGGHNV